MEKMLSGQAKLVDQEKWIEPLKSGRLWVPPVAMSIFLVVLIQYSFLGFHTLVELFSIIISFLMFAFSWSARDFVKNNFLLFLACGYFWIGSLDLMHTLVYKGINVFVEGSGNLSVQFWLGARYSEALLLLAAPFAAARSHNGSFLVAAFGVVAIGLTALILSGNFPTGFVEGKGLTDFKIYSEYLIIFILISSFCCLFRSGLDISTEEKVLISVSILMSIFAELAFTFYVSVYGLSNLVGHFLKLFSFWFIYQAVIISNLKKPYAALRESEEKYHTLTTISPVGVFYTTPDGDCVFANDKWCRISGLPREKALGKGWAQGLHPDDREMVFAEWYAATREQRPFFAEYRFLTPGKDTTWVIGQAAAHHGQNEEIIGYVGTITDITELKRSESALKHSERNQRSILENMQDTIYRGDPDGFITMASPSAKELTGYDVEELVGTKLASYYRDPDVREEFLRELQAGGGKIRAHEAVIIHKDGHEVWVSTNAHYHIDDNDKVDGIEGSIRDISNEKKKEFELSLANQKAETANKAKSEFLASMSHELRTPLNAILGFAQMMQFDPKNPLSQAQKHHIESILQGGSHLLELVNKILDLASVEADRLDLSLRDLNANEVVADCVGLLTPLADQRDIKIIDKCSSGPTSLLCTDHTRFKQVLINLLSNAIKFNKDGGTVTVVGQETDYGFLRLSVADTGMGIAKEDYSSIFQLFQRLDADPMIAREGTGIGLAVTKLLVERMAGRIGFDSEEGVGSTFWIDLPLASNNDVLIWTDAMHIGVEAIDKDHQVLVSMLNRVMRRSVDEADVNEVILELCIYTQYHFKREEAIMKACAHPGFEKHRDLHRELIVEVNNYARKWRDEQNQENLGQFRKFLKDWLFDHILNEDVKIASSARGRGQDIRMVLETLE